MTLRQSIHSFRHNLSYQASRVLCRPVRCTLDLEHSKVSHSARFHYHNIGEFLRLRSIAKRQYNEQSFLEGFVGEARDSLVIYDIGAHIGVFSVFSALAAGPEGRVIAFEMDQINFKALEANTRLNSLSNVRLVNAAVSNHSGELRYARPSELPGEGSISLGNTEQGLPCSASSITIDEEILAERLPVPDLVKIDVEGHEIDVIRGMRETLSQRNPVLFIELHDELLRMRNSSSTEVRRELNSLGYFQRAIVAGDHRAEEHVIFEKVDSKK